MRIKANFKDYYDYLSRLHGEDPQTIYVRLPRKGDVVPQQRYVRGKFVMVDVEQSSFAVPAVNGLPVFHAKEDWERDGWQVQTIYVCGVAYAVIQYTAPSRWVYPNGMAPAVEEKHGVDIPPTVFDLDHPFMGPYGQWFERLMPIKHRAIDELHKLTKMPVFRLASTRNWGDKTFHVDIHTPCLADFNFGKVLPAEKVWQDIQYYINNMINESPDMAPPPRPPQTDKEKLMAHGFDKRWSFRHRPG